MIDDNQKDDMVKKETFFIDIDGTLLKYVPFDEMTYEKTEALPGVVEWINKQRSEGHMVVLTSARPKDKRTFTTNQLRKAGIEYDELLLGMNRGVRTLINDVPTEYESSEKAVAINVNRNEGFENL